MSTNASLVLLMLTVLLFLRFAEVFMVTGAFDRQAQCRVLMSKIVNRKEDERAAHQLSS